MAQLSNVYFTMIMVQIIVGCECDCTGDYLPCGDGLCLYAGNWCDGRVDCTNKRDEQECADNPITCPNNWLPCGNGQCYHIDRRCNIYADCINGHDENDCYTGNGFDYITTRKLIISKSSASTTTLVTRTRAKTNVPTFPTSSTLNTPNVLTTSTAAVTKIFTADQRETTITFITEEKNKETLSNRGLSSIYTKNITSTTNHIKTSTESGNRSFNSEENSSKVTSVDNIYYIFAVFGLVVVMIGLVVVWYMRRIATAMGSNAGRQKSAADRQYSNLGEALRDIPNTNESTNDGVKYSANIDLYDEIDDVISEASIHTRQSYSNSSHDISSNNSESSIKNLPEAPPIPLIQNENQNVPVNIANSNKMAHQIEADQIESECSIYLVAFKQN